MNWLIWLGLICVTASCALALYAWVGRTLAERQARNRARGVPPQHVNCRCMITRPALPPADGFAQDQAVLCSDWIAVGDDRGQWLERADPVTIK